MDRRRNADVLLAEVDLAGKRVLDVGCGEGGLVRLMAKAGARVTGIEVNPEQLGRARAADAVADEDYIQGVGEDLPFGDGSVDVVVFFNSLHHVDVENQDQALLEAARVLRPGGTLYVAEPLAEGPHFEVMQPAHDETYVRAKADEALGRAPAHGFGRGRRFTYVNAVAYAGYDVFRDRILAINPHRAGDMAELEPELRARFDRLTVATDKGVELDQPMRVDQFEREDKTAP